MHLHSQRVQFLDFMRGFAVIVMVIGHSIDSVLSPETRLTDWFRLYDIFRGFTAPVFLFVSGYVFSAATEKRWSLYQTFSWPLQKRLMRMFLILIIGYGIHLPFFSLTKVMNGSSADQLAMLFQADVLQCVAVSILLLQLIVFVVRTPRAFAYLSLSVAAAIVLMTPVVWSIDLAPIVSPVLSPYFNQIQISMFPLFPYTAYLLLGAVTGHFYVVAQRMGRDRDFIIRIIVGSLIATLIGLSIVPIPQTLYPEHDFWKASPVIFLTRISFVVLVTGGFYFIREVPPFIARHLIALGQASLLVYSVHLFVVYGSSLNSGLAQLFGQTLHFPQAILIAISVLLVMTGLTHAWKYLRTHYHTVTRTVQVSLATGLVFFFLTKPY